MLLRGYKGDHWTSLWAADLLITRLPWGYRYRFGLSTLNPLLGQVSELAEGSRGALRTTFAPGGWVGGGCVAEEVTSCAGPVPDLQAMDVRVHVQQANGAIPSCCICYLPARLCVGGESADGMALPYTSASIHVEPMRLRLAAAPLVTELVTGEGAHLRFARFRACFAGISKRGGVQQYIDATAHCHNTHTHAHVVYPHTPGQASTCLGSACSSHGSIRAGVSAC